jgi:UDP-2,4-diacetamido-2,4,6-trideoxy-beta-L-altropyranose hydrolase
MSVAAVAVSRVTLRRVTAADSERVWEWNFAPDVRARSVSIKMVTFAEHERWFARRLADVGSPMWIVEADRIDVGIVRIDRVQPKGASVIGRISIALAARARGRGIGRRAIAAACSVWARPVVAQIVADNLPSLTAFAACGFKQVDGPDHQLLTYHWSP